MSLHSCQQDLFWYKTSSDACLLSAGISRPPATCSALCWARQGPRKCESLVPQRLTTRLTKDIMTFPQRSASSHGAGPGCAGGWRINEPLMPSSIKWSKWKEKENRDFAFGLGAPHVCRPLLLEILMSASPLMAPPPAPCTQHEQPTSLREFASPRPYKLKPSRGAWEGLR